MKIDAAIVTLNAYMRGQSRINIDVRAQLIVTVVYLVAVLSVPTRSPGMLVWMLCYPIVMSEATGVGYLRLLLRSLWVLPLILLIGVFNPILDREPYAMLLGVTVTRGWVTFAGLTLRGLLSVQALLLLVSTSGFNGICRALSRLGVPDVLVTQLMMLYRYLIVVLEEAQVMHRSRQSRGFGRRSYPLAMWGTFVGQLLMRSLHRAQRVNRAMMARGFDGNMPIDCSMSRWSAADWFYLMAWTAVMVVLRFYDLSSVI